MNWFSLIPVLRWSRLTAYVSFDDLINADVRQPRLAPTTTTVARDGECRQWTKNGKSRFGDTCVYTQVTHHRTAGASKERRADTVSGSACSGVADGSTTAVEAPAKIAKGKGKVGAAGSGGDGSGGGGSSGSGGGGGGGGGSRVPSAGASTRSSVPKADE